MYTSCIRNVLAIPMRSLYGDTMGVKISFILFLAFMLCLQGVRCTPVFTKSLYEFIIFNNGPGDVIGKVSATISDNSGVMTFRILGDAQQYLHIDQRTGALTLLRHIDENIHSMLSFKVLATEVKRSASTSTVANIRLILQNDDNNFPTFLSDKYEFVISRSAPVGSFLGQISATDIDKGQNGVISYRISSNPYESYFVMNRSSGSIHVAKPLSAISRSTIDVPVVATDGGQPPLTTLAVITIKLSGSVSSTMASLPQRQSRITFTVREDAPLNTYVGQIGHGNESTFRIQPLENSPFAINSEGWLYTVQALDRETLPEYHVIVYRQDLDSVTYKYLVTVLVHDVNDNAPIFSSSNYSYSVLRSASIGDTVGQVLAVDADYGTNGMVTYSIPHSNLFNVDKITGTISIANSLGVTSSHLKFVIFASDGGTPRLVSQVPVTVEVIDDILTTKSTPLRTYINKTFHVKENLPAGISLGQIGVVPGLSYSIKQRVPFVISHTDGVLRTAATLDREVDPVYYFNVSAFGSDGSGSTPRYNYHVTVVVDDVNDNIPTFISKLYQATVPSDSPIGTIVVRVEAVDADSSSTLYYMIPSFSGSVPFTIDSHIGEISTKENLLSQHYEFSVAASDGLHFGITSIQVSVSGCIGDDVL